MGLPVFANFKAGFGVLLGPTGGYIYGFVAAAFLVSAIAGSAARGRLRLWRAVAGCVVGLVFLYGFGAVQLKLLLDLDSFAAAFALGGIPYLFFEPLKIGAAVAAAQMLRQRLGR